MGFDTNKWFKRQYLMEAGLLENEETDRIHNLIYDANPSYSNLAKAIAKFLKGTEEDLDSGFSSDQIKDFMRILHTELGIKSLNEDSRSIEDITPENIDKIDISFVEGRTTLYAVYIYLKGREREYQWDKKLGSKEFQKVLDMLGIDIDFQDDPYYSADAVVKALEDKGYTATTSEFDVS